MLQGGQSTTIRVGKYKLKFGKGEQRFHLCVLWSCIVKSITALHAPKLLTFAILSHSEALAERAEHGCRGRFLHGQLI